MCVTICGRFRPDEGAVVGYGNRIRVKSPAKWGVQIAGMIFQTRSNLIIRHLKRLSVSQSGEFRGAVVGYGNRIRVKSPQRVQMRIFQTRSRPVYKGMRKE